MPRSPAVRLPRLQSAPHATGCGGSVRLRRLPGWQSPRSPHDGRTPATWDRPVYSPLLLGAWELVTAKLDLLPRPFFAAPQSLLDVYADDWPRLGESTLRSLILLVTGYAIGAVLGFINGVAIGWSRAIGYWMHPVLPFIGPLPATAWLPLAFLRSHRAGAPGCF